MFVRDQCMVGAMHAVTLLLREQRQRITFVRSPPASRVMAVHHVVEGDAVRTRV